MGCYEDDSRCFSQEVIAVSFGEEKDNSTLSFSFLGAGNHFIRVQRIYLKMQETEVVWVQSLSQEDPLEKEIATHSSILAWKIPWTKSGGLQSMGSQRTGHD